MAVLDSAAWTPRRSAPTEAELRERLLPRTALSLSRLWLLPLLSILLGAFLRFWHLGQPQDIAFDETYYVKDSWAIMLSGYEREWPDDADAGFAAGTPPEPLEAPSYAVHPPLGKILIGLGMRLFGAGDAFGWRFSSAVAGTLMIVLVVIAAALLFRSPSSRPSPGWRCPSTGCTSPIRAWPCWTSSWRCSSCWPSCCCCSTARTPESAWPDG